MFAWRQLLAAGVIAASAGGAYAAPLTLTELFKPADLEDPANAIAGIMKSVWADDIKQTPGAYSFTYALFEADKKQYLVSSFRSGSVCQPDECDWRIQRLTPDFRVEAAGKPFMSCGEINRLHVENDKLTICDKEAPLP